MAAPELSEQVHDWYAQITRGRATTLVELDDAAWGLLTPEWPRSYANNGLLVRRDPGSDQLIAWTESVLGDAEFNHRYVMAMCDLSPETRQGLAHAGYELEPELQMVRPMTDDDLFPINELVAVVDELVRRAAGRKREVVARPNRRQPVGGPHLCRAGDDEHRLLGDVVRMEGERLLAGWQLVEP